MSCRTFVSVLHKTIAFFTLSIIVLFHQNHALHLLLTANRWFGISSLIWGFNDFTALSDLNNPSKGFLMNDVVVVEAQITGGGSRILY